MIRSNAATVVAAGVLVASALAADTHKELRFNVGPRAGISVLNPYGSITVRPSTGNTVIVNALLHSDKVEIDNTQSSNRVDIQSHLLAGADAESGRVDYEILVPADAHLTLQSTNATLRAEGLRGDVTLEGVGSTVDVRDVADGHVHVKTMNGPVTLTNVRNGHVEVDSVSGEVDLNSVTGPLVQVISTSGRINYSGDFGGNGEYRLTSHSGDIEAAVPDTASADVIARSVKGEVHDEVHLQPRTHTWFPIKQGSAFAGTVGKAASSVFLRTFSGKILLRRRSEK